MRSGAPRPWVLDLSGRAPARELAIGDEEASEIAVSSDAARFVVATGHGLLLGRLSGDAPVRRLTEEGGDSEPSFRHGDAEVVFTRRAFDGAPRVMSVAVEGGGEPRPLLGPGTGDSTTSPTEDRVVYVSRTRKEAVPMLWDGRTMQARPLSSRLPAGHYASPRFSPDGRRVAILRTGRALLDVDVATGNVLRTIHTGNDETFDTPAYGPSGPLVLRIRWRGNLWIADTSL
jgi:dipeptidyl aminopeptidase/acylaminoacyl peptidase